MITLSLPWPDVAWALPDWRELVLPNDDGELHHGTEGCKPADGILIQIETIAVAVADCRHIGLDNLGAYDREYYQFLRLREVMNQDIWAETPWRAYGPGQILAAWDKFHGILYMRGVDDGMMSFGGEWSTLEDEVNKEHFPEAIATSAPSAADLLLAVRDNRVDRVRELLIAGVDPNGVTQVPPGSGLALGVSMARPTQPLWEAVQHASPEVTEALLSAGARVDAHPPGGMTALMGAVIAGRDAHVPVLMRYGANPRLTFNGKSVIDVAREKRPALLGILGGVVTPPESR